MTKILGIDFGIKKIGLAIAEGKLAMPLKVIKVESQKQAVEKIKKVVNEEKIGKIVIGIPEGEMEKQIMKFSKNLEKEFKIPIKTWDETLTTKDAQRLSIQSGIQRKKRKKMEDAYAATLILQAYIDSIAP